MEPTHADPGTFVTYRRDGAVATITMDDGKRNAISPRMLRELGAALDRAEADGAIVVLTGRDGVLSAGFDLKTLRRGGAAALAMVRGGFALAQRLIDFPTPVVVACGGHAIAMGAFLLLAGDLRIVARGPFKLWANEVAIGLPIPAAALEICRHRLSPAYLTRATLLAEPSTPENAIERGFADEVVAPESLAEVARQRAEALAQLDLAAHAVSKRRARGPLLRALRAARRRDTVSLVALGVRQALRRKPARRPAPSPAAAD
ncbi:MAG: crotonase/enoyl-CoA hydratase family protein [Nannocystaceae bacterium]